ncbi:MAG: carboxy terminal-processing peptidase [Bacteroidota bacterium]
MKYKGSVFLSLVVFTLLIGAAYFPFPNNAEKEAVLMYTLLGGLNQLHFDPEAIDDDYSKKVFDMYLDRIDGGRRWLTQEEVGILKKHEVMLDDEANAGTYNFFNESVELLSSSLERSQELYREVLAAPFDFSKQETIELDGDKKPFAKNEKELKEYWRKSMKYQTLVRLNAAMQEQEEGLEDGKEKKSFEELEKEAREGVLEAYDDWYVRLKKRKRSDFLSNYLNAFTNVFDPHSGYYRPRDKENFDIGMSGTLEGIGARLQANGEYTKVVHIVPGGPAWKMKGLQENDVIMSVRQDEEEEAVDVTGFLIDDVVKIIRGKKGTKVHLKIKKVDGTVKTITITRDIVVLEEGYAKSVILDMPDVAANIGYIKLPRFYADFNYRGGPSCAEDIAKELEKLKNENVNGVILDLRNNGGGSLRDVVQMSGLFIEEGPIVQVKARGNRPEVLADEDPKVQYGGPLIVMVNSISASASEILAAALQDYGRAVIVGSPSTYGKGTVQRFFDLDRAIRGNEEIKPLGQVKLTIQKYYRVNGGSTQMKGVTPDIILPDRYQYVKIGEQEYEHALDWTEISPVKYGQNVVKLDNMKQLQEASAARVSSSPKFQKVVESAKWVKERNDESLSSLNYEAFDKDRKDREVTAEKYEDMFEEIPGLKATNMEIDLTELKADESKMARNEEWIKTIKKDIYIEETLAIMRDMIKN